LQTILVKTFTDSKAVTFALKTQKPKLGNSRQKASQPKPRP